MKAIGVGAVILAVVLQAGSASAQQAGHGTHTGGGTHTGAGHANGGHTGAAHHTAAAATAPTDVMGHLTHDAQVLDPNDPRVAQDAAKIRGAANNAVQQGRDFVQMVEEDAALITALSGLPANDVITELEQAAQDDLRQQEKKLETYAEAHAGEWISKGESVDAELQKISAGVTPSQHPRVPQNILDEITHVVPNDQHLQATVAQVNEKLDQVWTEADKARHLQQQIEGAGAIVGILTGLPVSGAIANVNAIADAELKQVESDVLQHLGGAAGAIGAAGGVVLGGLDAFDNATRDRDYNGDKKYSDNHNWAAKGDTTLGGSAGYGDYIPNVDVKSHTILNDDYGHNILTVDAKHKVFGYGDPNGINHLVGGYEVTGTLGYELKGNAGYQVTSHSVAGQAGADVFVGAKAGVQGTFDVSVCGIDIKGTGSASGNAGAGADIGGHFSIDWSNMSINVGGNIGATLGLGADLSGDVTVSLGGVFQHPGQALGCVWDGVKKLGEVALKAGEKLVTAAYDVTKTAVTTLAKGAVSVAKAVGNGIKNVASGIGKALGGLFGHHKKKSSPPPPPPPPVIQPLTTPWIVPGLANIDGLGIGTLDLGWKMPDDMPTDMPMAAGDAGANVGRDAATMPNADNGWGYGANAYTDTGAGSGTTTANTDKTPTQKSIGWIGR